jgi:predicted transcriptional regulator
MDDAEDTEVMTIRMPIALKEKLQAVAKINYRSTSAQVRLFLEDAVSRSDTEIAEEKGAA